MIEEQLELEDHDSTPDLEMEPEESEVAEDELELEDTKMQLEDEVLEEDIDEMEDEKEKKPFIEPTKHRGSTPQYPAHPKNESGSFFDQFD